MKAKKATKKTATETPMKSRLITIEDYEDYLHKHQFGCLLFPAQRRFANYFVLGVYEVEEPSRYDGYTTAEYLDAVADAIGAEAFFLLKPFGHKPMAIKVYPCQVDAGYLEQGGKIETLMTLDAAFRVSVGAIKVLPFEYDRTGVRFISASIVDDPAGYVCPEEAVIYYDKESVRAYYPYRRENSRPAELLGRADVYRRWVRLVNEDALCVTETGYK